jgi:integrase
MNAKLILLKKSKSIEYFKIRLTEDYDRSYKTIIVPFTVKEWNYKKQCLKGVKPDKSSVAYQNFIDNQRFISDLETKYNTAINNLVRSQKPFSFSKVFDMVKNPNIGSNTLYSVFEMKIQELKADEKFGTANVYQGTLNKLKVYHKMDMKFNEVDSAFLIGFRKKIGNVSNATKSIHLRNIRTVFRYAIKKKIAEQNDYPFIDSDIWKDTATGYNSKAISINEVNKIRELKEELEEGSDMWNACNYFIFGYVAGGMNFGDIARLKLDNRQQGRIHFIRRKTQAKVQEETSFDITPEMKSIIRWYRTHNVQLNNPYIFPILNGFHDTEKRVFYRINKVRKQVNEQLKLIGEKIGSEVPITTYVWRHTFASVAKNELEADVTLISEMMGHKDLKTTQNYMKQFPDEVKDKITASL